jgi:hypothetical protein
MYTIPGRRLRSMSTSLEFELELDTILVANEIN